MVPAPVSALMGTTFSPLTSGNLTSTWLATPSSTCTGLSAITDRNVCLRSDGMVAAAQGLVQLGVRHNGGWQCNRHGQHKGLKATWP